MSGYAVGHVLRTSRFHGTSLLVLIVIAEATHQDGTGAWPAIASIAKLARTTDRSVRRVLSQLERAGELTVERNAGPRGTNLYAIPGVGQVRLGEDTGAPPDKVSPGHATRRPRTLGARTPDIAVSGEPSVPGTNPPTGRARARARAPEKIPSVAAEQKAMVRRAKELWTEQRKAQIARHGPLFEAYTDARALRAFDTVVPRALQMGEWRDIERAVRLMATDAKASPWRLPERTLEAAAARSDQERTEQQMREREEKTRTVSMPDLSMKRRTG